MQTLRRALRAIISLSIDILQDQKHLQSQFIVLEVEEDNVPMSEYVKKKHGSFQTERAFYELHLPSDDKKDLEYYKEVVYVQEEVCCFQLISQ